jgi:hypothetical protein
MPMLPVVIPVPFHSQWGLGANRRRTDCGPASLLMAGQYFGKMMGLTVDDLSAQTTLMQSDSGLMPQALVTLALLHNFHIFVHTGTTLADIRREIDEGRPVIALVHYRFITGRLDQADNNPASDGHFFDIIGYDDSHVVANDPDYWSPFTERGHNTFIPVIEIEKAMAGFGNICLFVKENQPMGVKEQLSALLVQAQTLVGQLPDTAQAPATPRDVKVNGPQGNVNVRRSPGEGTVIKLVANGTALKVIDSPTFNWSQITEGSFGGVDLKDGYIYTPFLTFQ